VTVAIAAPIGDGFRFVVHGIPAPQGSKKAFVAAGRAMMKESNADAHALWRNQVSLAATEAHRGRPPLTGPLRLFVEFRFPMPKSRPKYVRDLRSVWKTTAPDTDKLIRSVGDALTAAGVIVDDALFAELVVRKLEVFEMWTGADIAVSQTVGRP
jgi:Holliday junction resolvase RusA-like endonuclease